MAIDLTPFDLPVTPGERTGLYEIPEDQASVILDYASALATAKQANVAGDPVARPQVFYDKVIGDRVRAAMAGGATWTTMCQAMQRDIDAWQVRIGARAVRALRRQPGGSSQTRANAVMAVVRDAAALDAEQIARLDDTFRAAVARDLARTEEVLRGVPKPHYGSLRRRALEQFHEHRDADLVRPVIESLPDGAWHAAVEAFMGEELKPPLRAILAGPWREIAHGDIETLEGAWTEEADRIREDFLGLPTEAWEVDDPDAF